MKRLWESDELLEAFSLNRDEVRLLGGKGEAGQLGLGVLLKFFQHEGRFPYYPTEVPGAVVSFIAGQLGIGVEKYAVYALKGSVSKRDRAGIRDYTGFREPVREDLASLSAWIAGHPEGLQECG